MKKLTEMKINELRSHAAKLARALDIRKKLGKEHDRILKELKAERKRNRELAAKCDSLLTNSKGQYQSEMEELERFINEDIEAEYCSQTSHAMSDAKNIIRRQQKELSSLASKIADLEAQLADVSKAESGGKVDGVFEVGDEVIGTVFKERLVVSRGVDSISGLLHVTTPSGANAGTIHHTNLRHATPSTPCESCTAKQARIEELEKVAQSNGVECTSLHGEIARLKKDAHRDWIKSDRTDVELYNEKLASEELRTRIANQSTTIESYAADRVEMQNRIALDKSSILRLTRELSAALMRGGE